MSLCVSLCVHVFVCVGITLAGTKIIHKFHKISIQLHHFPILIFVNQKKSSQKSPSFLRPNKISPVFLVQNPFLEFQNMKEEFPDNFISSKFLHCLSFVANLSETNPHQSHHHHFLCVSSLTNPHFMSKIIQSIYLSAFQSNNF